MIRWLAQPGIACVLLACAAVLLSACVPSTSEQPSDAPRVAPFRADSTTVAACDAMPYERRVTCLAQAYGNLAFRAGPRDAVRRVERALGQASHPVKENCHRIMHAVGAASLERFAGSIERAFAAGTPLCASGYHHGVVEQVSGFDDQLELEDTCRDIAGRIACLHGLGHGIAIAAGYDRDRALDRCRELPGADERPCLGGAMMELFMMLRDGSPAGSDERSCDGVAADLAIMCARARGAGRVWTTDLADAQQAAARACVDAWGRQRAACAGAVGETLAERAAGDDDLVARACAAMGVDRRSCLAGASRFATG